MKIKLLKLNDNECFLPIPDELLKELNWKEGDTILVEDTLICNDDGEVEGLTLEKIEDENK